MQRPFPDLLKTWRSRMRISQLALALESGLSQRHLSFLETGRSQPSRAAIAQIGEALNMPVAEIDALLIAAGFAPPSSNKRWGEETRVAVNLSIDHVLLGHEPYPAIAIDRVWNIQKANLAAQSFFTKMGSNGDVNVLRDMLKPGRLKDNIVNWNDSVKALMRIFELEIARRPNDIEALELHRELLSLPGVSTAVCTTSSESPSPVMAIRFNVDGQVLNLFSLIATIGMGADALIDDMRIETLLPADKVSREWFLKNNEQ